MPPLVFLPDRIVHGMAITSIAANASRRSHSEIFPTSPWLTGYCRKYAEENYDALLDSSTHRYVQFGRSLAPDEKTDLLDTRTSQTTLFNTATVIGTPANTRQVWASAKVLMLADIQYHPPHFQPRQK